MPNPTGPDVGAVNRRAMLDAEAAAHYAASHEIDAAERALFDLIAPEAAGKPVLDIGVGGGRTVPALTAISADYTAVDYAPVMVEATKRRYPDLRVLHADARDLSRFGDGSMFLVVFSCAGIDMVNAQDRLTVLREVRRLIAPGGAFIFSTHNLAHRRLQHDPTLLQVLLPIRPTGNPVRLAWRVARSLPGAVLRVKNYRALRSLAENHEDWAILNSKYHHYGTLMHYITLAAQRAQLERVGFEPGAIAYGDQGEIRSGDAPEDLHLHIMARVPRAG